VETWRLITTWGTDPAFNMGLDEALLESDESAPTLRLYTWRPEALSLGYFQRYDEVPAAARAPAVVRRITGGGAIHHSRELTFSIAASIEHPLYRGPVTGSYERVHEAVARALAAFGVPARPRGAEGLLSDAPATGMCFHHSTPLDLCWNGRKGVGSAQRRRAGRVLHHGSIKIGRSPLEGAIASADQHAPGLRAESFAPALLEAFRAAFDAVFEAGVPTPTERDRARELGPRYVDPEFVRRR